MRPGPSTLGYAYRIADAGAWKAWLGRIAGSPAAELEVVHRTLRVRDQVAGDSGADNTQAAQAAPSMPLPVQPQPVAASELLPIAAPAIRRSRGTRSHS